MTKRKTTLNFLITLILGLVVSLPLYASRMSQSDLPMSQFNFQGFVPDSKENRRGEEDPNLIRLMVNPSFYWTINRIIDQYQQQHNRPFRIHQGSYQDFINLIEDGETFDLVIFDQMAQAHELLAQKRATEARVLAIGRIGLWAPLESARSLTVINLQNGPIGLMPEHTMQHQAAREVLERGEMLRSVEPRLQTTTEFQDLYSLIEKREIPMGFLPWQRIIEGGIQQQRDVLKLQGNHHSSIIYAAALTRAGSTRMDVKHFWQQLFEPASQNILKQSGFD
ncbi:MAG: substrate-binding domain-containing protein [Marinospirillum sp.]|nr:substrate-binding domain-containing protein [Marinospirillum sp.]